MFSAGFESGDDGFTHSGTADEWERGTPATGRGRQPRRAGRAAPRAPAASRPTSTAGTSRTARRTSCRRRSRSRAAPGRSTPPGQMWYQLERAALRALHRVGRGGRRRQRAAAVHLGGRRHGRQPRQPERRPCRSPPGWGRHRADISDYAGKTIRLRFHLDSDATVQRAGRRDRRRARLPAGVRAGRSARRGRAAGTWTRRRPGIDCGSDAVAHPTCSVDARAAR